LTKVDELIERAKTDEFKGYLSRELAARALIKPEGGLESVPGPPLRRSG